MFLKSQSEPVDENRAKCTICSEPTEGKQIWNHDMCANHIVEYFDKVWPTVRKSDVLDQSLKNYGATIDAWIAKSRQAVAA